MGKTGLWSSYFLKNKVQLLTFVQQDKLELSIEFHECRKKSSGKKILLKSMSELDDFHFLVFINNFSLVSLHFIKLINLSQFDVLL